MIYVYQNCWGYHVSFRNRLDIMFLKPKLCNEDFNKNIIAMVKWYQKWISRWSGFSGEDGKWGQILLVRGSSEEEMWCSSHPSFCVGGFHLLSRSELLPLFTYDQVERKVKQQVCKWSLQTSTTSRYTSDRFQHNNDCIRHSKEWNGRFGGVSKFPYYDKHRKWSSG